MRHHASGRTAVLTPDAPAVATPLATPITVAAGDGIGPEITAAVLRILDAAGARLAIEEIPLGLSMVERGWSSGIDADGWASLRRTRVLLKGPLTTPQGGGVKSVNVTLRKTLSRATSPSPGTAISAA